MCDVISAHCRRTWAGHSERVSLKKGWVGVGVTIGTFWETEAECKEESGMRWDKSEQKPYMQALRQVRPVRILSRVWKGEITWSDLLFEIILAIITRLNRNVIHVENLGRFCDYLGQIRVVWTRVTPVGLERRPGRYFGSQNQQNIIMDYRDTRKRRCPEWLLDLWQWN